LIELLVVIAIIGILSSVVLASLSTARNKGKDASAKGSISAIRSSAEIYYNAAGANSYGTTNGAAATTNVCGETSGDVPKLLTAASTQTGTTAICTVGTNAGATTGVGGSYEAHITLLDTTVFCVDSNGFSGKPTGTPTAGTASVAAKCQ
jgi:type II secretory pathway pseudopilin PulG